MSLIIYTYNYDSNYNPAMPVVEIEIGRDVLNHLTVTLDGPASSVQIAA